LLKTKTTLVLCPGLLNDGRVFGPLLDALGDSVSPVVADVAAGESVGALAGLALERAPERFALLGFSMGGYVAFEILRQAPGRVERLALVSTSARADTPEQTAQRQAMLRLSAIGQFSGVTPRLLPRLVHPARLDDAAVTAPILAMAAAIGREGFRRQQTAIMNRPDSRDTLGRIRVPTLVLCGRDDRLTPPDLSQEIAAAIPGARLVLVEACGHCVPLERPEAIAGAVAAWLSGG
jgi:pimeloyl-ACP methyl ester carboxylesterase